MTGEPLLDDLLTDSEVRRLLAVSRTTLWRLRKEAGLPFGRAGRKYLYRRSEILQWVKDNRQHAPQAGMSVEEAGMATQRTQKRSRTGGGNGTGSVARPTRPAVPLAADGTGSYDSPSSRLSNAARTASGGKQSKDSNPKLKPRTFHKTSLGKIVLGDALDVLRETPEHSIDLIMTSPPFGLVRKKAYGNADADEYVDWFRPFGEAFMRVLKKNGSLVIDLGGAWVPGQPTRSLYHLKLPIMLCDDIGFNLAQEFYWWNPSKLPTPAEWVTVRRVRVKDAINCVWWLSPTPWPKASNTRVLQPYSDSMLDLLKNGYKPKLRPSGHDISSKFGRNNGAAIPPNLIAVANTESNGRYLRYCKEHALTPHPARYPSVVPEYFIRMLTNSGDLVVDPFAGSCVTGEVCERIGRKWICVELQEDYLKGALARFETRSRQVQMSLNGLGAEGRGEAGDAYYKIPRPGLMWNGRREPPLDSEGGQSRPRARRADASR